MKESISSTGPRHPAPRKRLGVIRFVLLTAVFAAAWAMLWVSPSMLRSSDRPAFVFIHDSTWHWDGKLVFGSSPPPGKQEQTATVMINRWTEFQAWDEPAITIISANTTWTRAPKFDAEFLAAARRYHQYFGGNIFLESHPDLYADLLMREGRCFRVFTFGRGITIFAVECLVGGAALASLATLVPAWIRQRIRAKRRERDLCIQCGYPREGAACPECGRTHRSPPAELD